MFRILKRKNTLRLSIILLLIVCAQFAAAQSVTVSGKITDDRGSELQFVNVQLKKEADSSFVQGTVSNENGRFVLEDVSSDNYIILYSSVGYEAKSVTFRVGELSEYLDLGTVVLNLKSEQLKEMEVSERREEVSSAMDRKTFTPDENLSQLGGSVLQALQNLPGVTTDRDGKVTLRGSDQIAVLINGKQTALTGFGRQEGLDNIPASAVERIEIINNPSAKYDATGMGGIINIVLKKEEDEGWNGKAGMLGGVGGLTEKRANMPDIRDQYRFTPKVNPSASLNYRKENLNFFVNGDVLWRQKMMKNEFIERVYDDGEIIDQQFLENRTQPIYNAKTGLDWQPNEKHEFTFFSLFNYRAYNDLGDLPYFNRNTGQRVRYWQYDEDEVNQTFTASLAHTYKFDEPGHKLETMANYSFRRKDEAFNFINQLPDMTGTDTTELIADEHIVDLEVDYTKPLKHGKMELGTKQRSRNFPNQITFRPGENSILDPGLAGSAEYRELLSAYYGNFVYESTNWEVEAGLRVEYAEVDYLVDPDHSVYEDGSFNYLEPFPNLRASFRFDDRNKLSLFYNRRVDRPQERNLRSFATYADPEILHIGNPRLIPQFTQTLEAGYKHSFSSGYLYAAGYYRMIDDLLTNIIVPFPEGRNLASVDQNAGSGTNAGGEVVLAYEFSDFFRFEANGNVYQNIIDEYRVPNPFANDELWDVEYSEIITGNAKLNLYFTVWNDLDIQVTGTYIARDLVPQGEIAERYFMDLGVKKPIQEGKGELFLNVSDVLNTLVIEYDLIGDGFNYRSSDYFETQIVRLGYSYRF